jgi:hypothetical protein
MEQQLSYENSEGEPSSKDTMLSSNYFEGLLKVLQNLSTERRRAVLSSIKEFGEISPSFIYEDCLSGTDLMVVMAALRLKCMWIDYESHENGGYTGTPPKNFQKFLELFSSAIYPIAKLLGLKTSLEDQFENRNTLEPVCVQEYCVRKLPNEYLSSDEDFMSKLVLATSVDDVKMLSNTIQLVS